MKSYRFFGDEMEVLGNRLDHARERASESKSQWARNYWGQTVERLLFQWRLLPILHDGEALTTIIPKWTIDYNFYERDYGNEGQGIVERAIYGVFKQNADLNASWERHREQRLAKAQY